jgi:hypothetical protein
MIRATVTRTQPKKAVHRIGTYSFPGMTERRMTLQKRCWLRSRKPGGPSRSSGHCGQTAASTSRN